MFLRDGAADALSQFWKARSRFGQHPMRLRVCGRAYRLRPDTMSRGSVPMAGDDLWYWPDWPNERHDREHLQALALVFRALGRQEVIVCS